MAFATSAIRSTRNGVDFVVKVKTELGLHIEVIDGNKEAEIHLDARNQTGWRTVPIIWDLRSSEPVFVGGSDELILLLNQSTE